MPVLQKLANRGFFGKNAILEMSLTLGVLGAGPAWEGCALSQPGSEQVVTDPAGAGLQARDSNAEHSYVQRHSNGSESGVQNAKKVNSEW